MSLQSEENREFIALNFLLMKPAAEKRLVDQLKLGASLGFT